MKDIMSILEQLTTEGIITKDQVKKAQEQSRISSIPVDKILIKEGVVSEEELVRVFASKLDIPFMDLKDYIIDADTIKYIPEKIAREKNIVPLFKLGNSLTVAVCDPRDIMAIDQVRLKSGLDVELVLATESAIKNAVEQLYGVSGTLNDVLDAMDKQKLINMPDEISAKALEELAQEAPVVKFVNLLILEAVKQRASDIHIEPEEDSLMIRLRIDGVLHPISAPSKHIQSAIISRIKVLSRMDIAEKRRPQDGRFQIRMENRDIDLRVSSFPTVNGENVVLRILDKASVILDLGQIGFLGDVRSEFEKLIRRPNGIILVTGPTGSGKTTTLYAAIQTINTEEINIITLEDPVEYHLPLIRQSQVNQKAAVTFATGLRSILRQDPDVIMVGEIRDVETADIAVQAALTGHLVFSTLHTNDAAGTILRLLDMGVEPFLVSSSLIGILAQRLVRVLCPKCKEKYRPPEGFEAYFRKYLEGLSDEAQSRYTAGMEGFFGKDAALYRGKGCKVCNNTGFYGRVGIFELLIINDPIKRLIVAKASSEDIKKAAQQKGMKTLWEDGIAKVRSGITTLEEVARVTTEQ